MVRFVKVSPTTYVMQFRNGKVRREGAGLSFLYWAPTTVLVEVPVGSRDTPFVFTELTADYQTVTVQGQLTHRVVEPRKLATLLDFSVGRDGAYLSEDPMKVEERLVHAAQVLTRAATERWTLREALARGEPLAQAVLAGLNEPRAAQGMGIEVLSVSILSIRPTPEMSRALEADAREALQRQSDEALYQRRTAAVALERTVKESELSTEIMVEQKRRHIRETAMEADIAVERERRKLVEEKSANDRAAADAQAYALEATLAPLRSLDWKVLSALSGSGQEPGAMIAVAFRELAENAQRIGELNVSPELLRSLLGPGPQPAGKR